MLSNNLEAIHFATVLQCDNLFLLALFLSYLLLFDFLLALHLLVLLALNDSDLFIQFSKQMRQFRVYLVDKIAEICACLVVDPLEEHYRCEILLKILNLILR
jgi:hypothetical protein